MPGIVGNYLTHTEIRNTATTLGNTILGQRAETMDGRIFRWVGNAGTALVRGNLLQSPAVVANHANRVIGDAAAVGDLSATLDLGATSAAENLYAGGYLVINDEAGEGIVYRISGHDAFDSSETSARVQLSEPIDVALTADTSEGSLISLWNDVIQSPTSATAMICGYADDAYAADVFCWVQVVGIAAVLNDGTPSVGGNIVRSGSVAGAAATSAADTASPVGRAVQTYVNTEHRATYLMLN